MPSPKLENAKQRLNEAIADAVPAVNIDFTASIALNEGEKFHVQLRAVTKKGEAYLPYLSEQIKQYLKEKK